MARRANGEGSITTTIRNGKTYYRGSVTIGIDNKGKAIRKTFGSFKKAIVIDKMNDAKYESKNNILSNSDISFGELYKYWINEFKKVEIKGYTFSKYEEVYKLRIEPYTISSKNINKITLPDLQNYFNELSEKYSPSVIKRSYIYINACFEFASMQGMIKKNFCPGVILQKVKTEKKIKVFTKEEQNLIIQNLDLRNIVDCVIYFTFYTGLRLGEVLGLTWDCIDGKILKIKQQYARVLTKNNNGYNVHYELSSLKTNESEREIPIPDKLIDLLNNLPKNSEFIFNSNGQGLDHKRPQRRITKICRDLEIPHRSFHSIRHSYATRLFELGIPIKTVQSLMGHTDISTTMNIYTHVMQDKKMEILDKLNNL